MRRFLKKELLQESDGVTSCMCGCTILHKPAHAELVWGDLLGEIILELLEHGLVALIVDSHHPAVGILKPERPQHSPSGIEGTEACDLRPVVLNRGYVYPLGVRSIKAGGTIYGVKFYTVSNLNSNNNNK